MGRASFFLMLRVTLTHAYGSLASASLRSLRLRYVLYSIFGICLTDLAQLRNLWMSAILRIMILNTGFGKVVTLPLKLTVSARVSLATVLTMPSRINSSCIPHANFSLPVAMTIALTLVLIPRGYFVSEYEPSPSKTPAIKAPINALGKFSMKSGTNTVSDLSLKGIPNREINGPKRLDPTCTVLLPPPLVVTLGVSPIFLRMERVLSMIRSSSLNILI